MIGENEVEIMIIGKNHDEYADGGIAPLTFMTKQVVGEHRMKSTWDNLGGWDESEMYGYLNNETDGVITTLSADVQAAIKPVVKTTTIGGGSSETETSNDKLFLLSSVETSITVTEPYNLEGSRYDYFGKTYGGTITPSKLYDLSGSASNWWLRSPDATNKSYFIIVNKEHGATQTAGAGGSNGVAFGFCF